MAHAHEVAHNITLLATIPGATHAEKMTQRIKPTIVQIIPLDDNEELDKEVNEDVVEKEEVDDKDAYLTRRTKEFKRTKVGNQYHPQKLEVGNGHKAGQEKYLDATTNDKMIFEKFLVKCIFLEWILLH